MGSLCGKQSPQTPHNPSRNSLLPSFVGGSKPGRALGSGYGELDNGEQPAPPNARVAAALAAEQRNISTAQKSGKLGAKLEQQKRKTQSQLLQEGAKKQPEQMVWD